MANFMWYFVAENDERLQAWINFDLSGTCTYRQNEGDVAIWILPRVEVKKGWGSEWDELETVFSQERWLNIWLATYDGPWIDDDVPQGNLNLNFYPTRNNYFPLEVSQGQRYIISVDVQIALLNSYNGVIMLGILALYPNPCSLKGDCVLCRCVK